MGRTKDQYIEYLNTLDQDDPQNREIQGRDGEGFVNSPPRQNNQSRSLRNNLNHLDKPTRKDRNVVNDR